MNIGVAVGTVGLTEYEATVVGVRTEPVEWPVGATTVALPVGTTTDVVGRRELITLAPGIGYGGPLSGYAMPFHEHAASPATSEVW